MSEGAGRGGVRCGILQECADSCGMAHDTNKLLLTPARLHPECNGRHAAAESITNVPVVHAKLDVLHKVEVLQRQISGRHGEVQWRHMMKSCAAHKTDVGNAWLVCASTAESACPPGACSPGSWASSVPRPSSWGSCWARPGPGAGAGECCPEARAANTGRPCDGTAGPCSPPPPPPPPPHPPTATAYSGQLPTSRCTAQSPPPLPYNSRHVHDAAGCQVPRTFMS